MKSPVYVEHGTKRAFACSLDWPGLCRQGRDEAAALGALSAYIERYAPVAERAGARFGLARAGAQWEVVERVPTRSGGADFGVPSALLEVDYQPLSKKTAALWGSLLQASWAYLDEAVAASPPRLTKGPRGGGRDRDEIYEHVVGAERMFASRAGLKLPPARAGDAGAVSPAREQVLEWCVTGATSAEPPGTGPRGGQRWPERYAIRRLCWHVLDHAWEVQDRRP